MLRSPLLAGGSLSTVEDGLLLGAIAQFPQALEPNPAAAWYRLPKSVLHKAQQLVHLLAELRSPQSGWPAHLPHTPEHLAPYVTEEAYELLAALRQLARQQQGGLAVVTHAEPLHLVDWQLRQMDLAALRSQLLWEIASSSHSMMQLLRGVRARVEDRPVWLHLIIRLHTQASSIDLNAPNFDAPNAPNRGYPLAPDAHLHIEGGNLTPTPQPAGELLAQIQTELARNPILQPFLKGMAVKLLQPHQRWHQTCLRIHARFWVRSAPADEATDAATVLVPPPEEPPPEEIPPEEAPLLLSTLAADLDQFLLSRTDDREDTAAISTPTVSPAPSPTDSPDLSQTNSPDPAQSEALDILTVQDLALALTGDAPPSEDKLSPAPASPAQANPSQANPSHGSRSPEVHQNGHHYSHEYRHGHHHAHDRRDGHQRVTPAPRVVPESLLPAWITVTDDRWIAGLSEMIARQQLIAELPLPQLMAQPDAPLEERLPLVIAAACAATDRALADAGLCQHNCFQQAVYLEDFLPQLLWYVHRTSAVVAQLIDGIPARFLAPDHGWATGELRLLTTLQLRTQQRKMMLNLATAQPLAYPVERLPRDGIVQSQVLPLTHAPHTVAQLETRLYRLLRQATPELDWLLRGTSLELHLLEADHEPALQVGAMQLGLGLQFIPTPTTVVSSVIGDGQE